MSSSPAADSSAVVCFRQTLDEYKSVLDGLLDGQSSDRNIVIILDGVDELEDFESCADLLCSWVPRQLPGNVKLLLTLRDPQLLQSKTSNSAALHQVRFFTSAANLKVTH